MRVFHVPPTLNCANNATSESWFHSEYIYQISTKTTFKVHSWKTSWKNVEVILTPTPWALFSLSAILIPSVQKRASRWQVKSRLYSLRMQYKFGHHKFAWNNSQQLSCVQLLQNIRWEISHVTSKFAPHLHLQGTWTGLRRIRPETTIKKKFAECMWS